MLPATECRRLVVRRLAVAEKHHTTRVKQFQGHPLRSDYGLLLSKAVSCTLTRASSITFLYRHFFPEDEMQCTLTRVLRGSSKKLSESILSPSTPADFPLSLFFRKNLPETAGNTTTGIHRSQSPSFQLKRNQALPGPARILRVGPAPGRLSAIKPASSTLLSLPAPVTSGLFLPAALS
jgi:hypothetical protein